MGILASQSLWPASGAVSEWTTASQAASTVAASRSCSPLRITPASAVINRRRASREKTPYADTDFTKSSDTLAKVSSPDVKSCDGAAEACVKGWPPAAVGRHDPGSRPKLAGRGSCGSHGRVRATGRRAGSLDRTAAEDQALQQRVGGQPVGAVHAGAGHLAGGVEARQRGAARQVGEHAAHPVVGGRGHGHGRGGPVVASGEGGRRDGREAPGQEARAPLASSRGRPGRPGCPARPRWRPGAGRCCGRRRRGGPVRRPGGRRA